MPAKKKAPADKKKLAAKPRKATAPKPKAAKVTKALTALKDVKAKKSVKVAAKKAQPKKLKKTEVKKAAKSIKPVVKAKAEKSVSLKKSNGGKKAELLHSEVVFQGPLFRVLRDKLVEPSGVEGIRDVIRHNGSVVILAVDATKSKRDPYIVMERQYRHAANQYLWELPAGKLEAGEDGKLGGQRELEEETGYKAKKWKLMTEYYASPGFLGESMKIYLAEELTLGAAHPEEDEKIEVHLVKLSEILKAIEKGQILDGKTLTGVLLYSRLLAAAKKK